MPYFNPNSPAVIEFAQGFDLFVKRYLIWYWYILALIEISAIILRKMGVPCHLVSYTAREAAYKGLPTLAYFMAGMTFHWFVTWYRVPWHGTTASILGFWFWLVGVVYFAADMLDPNYLYWPLWAQRLRYPPTVALIGAANAWICFPQKSVWFPGRP